MQRLLELGPLGAPDIVAVRQTVRRLTRLLDFEYHDQVRITTAVSELTRAASLDGGGDVRIEFFVSGESSPQRLVVRVSGPGLLGAQRPEAVDRIVSARRLLEPWTAEGVSEQTLTLAKTLPRRVAPVDGARARLLRERLGDSDEQPPGGYSEELSRQTVELSATLLEVEEKQKQIATLTAELADTNRGVMALYAELDERATHLRRADELKTRFFSNMSHEFRTPLNSILALARLLLAEVDGELGGEQKKQVRLIRDSASELLELVGDLLDFAKVEAGKSTVNVAPFSAAALFGALRGMIRPLIASSAVTLDFGTVASLPSIVSDEGKVAQILRNFLSNAVKFTERGSISVEARLVPAGTTASCESVGQVAVDSIEFRVTDTGIGIEPADQDAIFEEFSQVRHTLQRRVRGTGLGLPLCKRLASLLGGEVWVDSEPRRGSTFYLLLPVVHEQAGADVANDDDGAGRLRLLIVSDDSARRSALEDLFADGVFTPVSARTAEITPALLNRYQPAVAVAEALSYDSDAVETIRAAGIPLVDASDVVLGADGAASGPDLTGAAYREVLRRELSRTLVVDDDETFRAVIARDLGGFCDDVSTMGDPVAAVASAADGAFDYAVVDIAMAGLDGFQVLQRLRANAVTRSLPVLLCSSKSLSEEEEALVRRQHAVFIAKDRFDPIMLARGLIEARLAAPRSGDAHLRQAAGDRR